MEEEKKEVKHQAPKRRSSFLKDWEERRKNYVEPPYERPSLEYQLGQQIGEYIVVKYLPVLETSLIMTRNVIKISEEDKIEHDRLHDLWSKKVDANNHLDTKENFWKGALNSAKEEWKEYYRFNCNLNWKYMPHELKMSIPSFDVENMKELLEGIQNALWNCDCCSYSCATDEIEIGEFNRYAWARYITLRLDTSVKID